MQKTVFETSKKKTIEQKIIKKNEKIWKDDDENLTNREAKNYKKDDENREKNKAKNN